MLHELRSMRARVAALDAAVVSISDCVVVSAELAKLKNACAAAEARFAARAGQRADDLARVNGSSAGAAKAAIETASQLVACPDTAAALASGDLSLEQAHEITRTEREVPGSEAELLQLAKSSGLRELRDAARKRRHDAIGADELHRRQLAARSFRHWKNDLGNIAFAGELPPEHGVPFVNRLAAECDRIRRDAKKKGGELESHEAYAADALVRLVNRGGAKRGPNVDAVVVVDLAAWQRGHAGPGERCHVIGGGDVPVAVAKEMAENAFIKGVLYDGVDITKIKHFGRHIPAELRTALQLGDAPEFRGATCVDCGSDFHTEWDHVDPVANWGPTSYENLKARCWRCHRTKTERDRKAGLLDGRGGGRSP